MNFSYFGDTDLRKTENVFPNGTRNHPRRFQVDDLEDHAGIHHAGRSAIVSSKSQRAIGKSKRLHFGRGGGEGVGEKGPQLAGDATNTRLARETFTSRKSVERRREVYPKENGERSE